ncbi:hypothetical protein LCGC14_2157760, partial [marine sediment metagenome]
PTVYEQIYEPLFKDGKSPLEGLLATTLKHYRPLLETQLFVSPALGVAEKWDVKRTPPTRRQRFRWWRRRTWNHWTSLRLVFSDTMHDDCDW